MLIEKQELLKLNNSYIDLKVSNDKTSAKDLCFITPNKSQGRLNLIIAKKVSVKDDELIGKNVSFISYFQSENKEGFDPLIVESEERMITEASNLSKYMKSETFSLNPVHLPTKMLLIRSQIDKNSFNLAIMEIFRRIALSFSPFSFTFIGICFGTDIGRVHSKKKLLLASLSSLLILLSFTIGKGFKYHPVYACAFYVLPQILILGFSARYLHKLSRGIE